MELLNSLDIPVVVENPNVGENLEDHAISGISFEVIDEVATADSLMRQEPEVLQLCMEQYMTDQTGPFSYGCLYSHAFMPITDELTGNGKSELDQLFSNYAEKNHTDFTFDSVDKVTISEDEASACTLMFPAQINAHDDKGEKGGKNYLQMAGEGNFITIPLCSAIPYLEVASILPPPTSISLLT